MKNDKVLDTKSMVIFMIFSVVLVIGAVLFSLRTESILYRTLAIVFLIVVTLLYRAFEKQKTIKIFQGSKFERIGILGKHERTILILVGAILIIMLIAIILVSEEDMIIPLLLALVLFYQIFTNMAYASKDILVYNNTVLRINKIENVEKESKKMSHHIRYTENGKSKRMKVGNRYTRDKIYTMIKDRM